MEMRKTGFENVIEGCKQTVRDPKSNRLRCQPILSKLACVEPARSTGHGVCHAKNQTCKEPNLQKTCKNVSGWRSRIKPHKTEQN